MDDKSLKKDLITVLLLIGTFILAILVLFFWDNHSHILEILSRKIFK